MERKGKICLTILMVLLIGVSAFGGYIAGQNSLLPELNKAKERIQILEEEVERLNQAFERLEKQLRQSSVSLDSFFNSDKTGTWSMSGGPKPPHVRFTKEIKISPYENPAEGEIQAFSIWVISEVSPVKEVTATIETTRGNLTIPFELVEGDRNYGKWEGFWIVRNILWKHDNWGNLIFPLRYVVNFGATNEVGEKEQSGFPIGKVVFQKIDHNYPVEGEIQTFTVWVCAEGIGPKAISREEASPVKEVTAKIKTGKGDVTIQFKLVEGDSRYGKWEGSWIVRDILWIKPDTGWPRCTIHFQAVNEANEESYVDYYIMKREGT